MRLSSGSALAAAKTSVALMAAIYSFDSSAQAGFFPSRITHYASRHP
jgi:hypothetical protein